MKKIIILRGCPGAGKSTFLQENYPEAFVCSATWYFTDSKNNYKFYPKSISQAHTFCQNAFLAALKNKKSLVAVDNTNIKIWEFEWYLDKAEEYGYEVEVLRVKVDDATVAAKRNVHGVSVEKVLTMHSTMEDYAGEVFV